MAISNEDPVAEVEDVTEELLEDVTEESGEDSATDPVEDEVVELDDPVPEVEGLTGDEAEEDRKAGCRANNALNLGDKKRRLFG